MKQHTLINACNVQNGYRGEFEYRGGLAWRLIDVSKAISIGLIAIGAAALFVALFVFSFLQA